MDLLEAYRAIVDAARAGADVRPLAEMFNKALAGGSLEPGFGELAARLAAEARWESLVSTALALAALAAAAAGLLLLYRRRREVIGFLWLLVWRRGLLKHGGGRPRTLLFDEEVSAVAAAVVVVGVALAVALLLRPAVAEPFSALGLLGPEGRIGGYPTNISAGVPVRLFIYVHNHEGEPRWYVVYIKIAGAGGEPPLPSPPVLRIERLLLHNESWVQPFSVSFNSTGRQRLVAELWAVYPNGTLAYTGRFVQLWVNVK
ncbi:DUF1616 domain-containing protein [Pyrobaculum ferrireducens]|uniref:DUF1616 domain-containing protein n=1 Tax=Pyrobaculum ferrireducens TaxID=1104324 RepID=G7VIH5_9CREN|nr:DUF1616 domain-containing protein [Pyrobaculum ferrireducens]AET33455.1 hypothetical protein P186_2060 [Pyrobaculum ferrireducens]